MLGGEPGPGVTGTRGLEPAPEVSPEGDTPLITLS